MILSALYSLVLVGFVGCSCTFIVSILYYRILSLPLNVGSFTLGVCICPKRIYVCQ